MTVIVYDFLTDDPSKAKITMTLEEYQRLYGQSIDLLSERPQPKPEVRQQSKRREVA